MGFDCFESHANKNTILRLDGNQSDSLVNNQILRESMTIRNLRVRIVFP